MDSAVIMIQLHRYPSLTSILPRPLLPLPAGIRCAPCRARATLINMPLPLIARQQAQIGDTDWALEYGRANVIAFETTTEVICRSRLLESGVADWTCVEIVALVDGIRVAAADDDSRIVVIVSVFVFVLVPFFVLVRTR